MSHVLLIEGLRANVGSREILRGIDLEVNSGEVHVVMGPNGSGKSTLSHVIAGRPGYEVTGGTVTLDGLNLLTLPAWQRARAGLFLAMQYPIEVPGVSLVDALSAAFVSNGRPPALVPQLLAAEADRVGLDRRFLLRPLNVDLSGGERKRNETVQLGVIGPLFAVLDEIDSGLDVDALRAVARRIEAATAESGLGVLAITHYNRLLHELHADRIHVLIEGRIVASGGPELAEELETTGYAAYGVDEPVVLGAAVGAGGAVGAVGNGGRAKPTKRDEDGPGPLRRPVRLGAHRSRTGISPGGPSGGRGTRRPTSRRTRRPAPPPTNSRIRSTANTRCRAVHATTMATMTTTASPASLSEVSEPAGGASLGTTRGPVRAGTAPFLVFCAS